MSSPIENPEERGAASLEELVEKENQRRERIQKMQQELRKEYIAEQEDLMKIKALQKHAVATAPDEQSVVPKKRKKFQPVSPEVKSLVLEKVFYTDELTWKEATEAYDISEATISRIIKKEKQRKEGVVPPQKKRGRKSPLTEEVMIWLLRQIEEKSYLTIEEMKGLVEKHFQLETSKSAIERALLSYDVTWKCILPIPVNWNTEEALERRASFLKELLDFSNFGRPVVFIDESSFNLHIQRSKGRSVSGYPAILSTVPKGKRITLIAALGEQGIIYYRLKTHSASDTSRGTTAEDFRQFLFDLVPKLPQNTLIILDNAKIHHANSLQSIWELLSVKNFEKLFLPPYSPFLNPIEYAFNDMKAHVKSKAPSKKAQLKTAIEEAIQGITSEKAKAFIDHSRKFYPQVAHKIPFRGKILDPLLEDINQVMST